jgi:hypothetical protein
MRRKRRFGRSWNLSEITGGYRILWNGCPAESRKFWNALKVWYRTDASWMQRVIWRKNGNWNSVWTNM